MPEAMRDEEGHHGKKRLAEYFVIIGRLDLRPGEILIGIDDKPNVLWTCLLGIQVGYSFEQKLRYFVYASVVERMEKCVFRRCFSSLTSGWCCRR